MRWHHVLGFVACLSLAGAAQQPLAAAGPKPPSSIKVTVAGLNCSTPAGTDSFDARSWSWGAVNQVSDSGGGGTAGKVVASDLSLQRLTDACSPALLGAVVTGRHYPTLSLTQFDSEGVATATLALLDVLITSWKIGGSSEAAEAIESVSVTFSRITFTDVASGNAFCYDLSKQVKC
jgi:type VI protein secretion system component Hcp